MKKHGNRNNVLKLKQRARNVKKRSKVDRFKSQVLNFMHMPDEEPSRGWLRASDVYRDYEYDCQVSGLKPCKKTTFAKIVADVLEKKKMTDGHMYYRPSPYLYNYLLSLLESGEEVKKAA